MQELKRTELASGKHGAQGAGDGRPVVERGPEFVYIFVRCTSSRRKSPLRSLLVVETRVVDANQSSAPIFSYSVW